MVRTAGFPILVTAFALFLASCTAPTPQSPGGGGGPFRLGVDVLAGNNWDLLCGKRVGLICNQTSMTGNGTMTRVAMKRAGVNLVALYAPEHGIDGTIRAGAGWTSLFVLPGFRFRVVDHLLTNFHLPRSTLIMLVSAFAGTERVLEAYREAVRQRYRFYSYGDAMAIL